MAARPAATSCERNRRKRLRAPRVVRRGSSRRAGPLYRVLAAVRGRKCHGEDSPIHSQRCRVCVGRVQVDKPRGPADEPGARGSEGTHSADRKSAARPGAGVRGPGGRPRALVLGGCSRLQLVSSDTQSRGSHWRIGKLRQEAAREGHANVAREMQWADHRAGARLAGQHQGRPVDSGPELRGELSGQVAAQTRDGVRVWRRGVL